MSAVKTALSLPKRLFDEMEEEARRQRVPRSRVYAEAAEEYLRRRRQASLLARINAAYADGPNPDDTALLERAGVLLVKSEESGT